MSNKIKRTGRSVIKKHDGKSYFFRNGRAKVPGVRYQGKPMMITLKEFDELRRAQ